MKTNDDLTIKIFLEIEPYDNRGGIPDTRNIHIEGYDDKSILDQVVTLIGRGLITGIRSGEVGSPPGTYYYVKLTTEGHEFLNNARNELT